MAIHLRTVLLILTLTRHDTAVATFGQIFKQSEASSNIPSISNRAEFREVAHGIATGNRQVIFSTFQVAPGSPHELARDLLRNLAYGLHANDVLQHSLLVAVDEYSAKFALEDNIPCVVDDYMPKLYTDSSNDVLKNPVVSKWLWAHELAALQLHVIFLDWDVCIVRNPLPFFLAEYDIQGLSDFANMPESIGQLQASKLSLT